MTSPSDQAVALPSRIVDSHHHLWDLGLNRYPWLSGPPANPSDPAGLGMLQTGYSAEQYRADTSAVETVLSVHVEAGHDPSAPVRETAWLDAVADSTGIPTAIVAHAALQRPDLAEILTGHAASPRLRGIRQMLDIDPVSGGHAETALMDDGAWHEGLDTLSRHGLSFDLQVLTGQLGTAARTAREHPDLTFVLNHGGYHAPADDALRRQWLAGVSELGAAGNVYVKASAYAAVDPSWSQDGLDDYMRVLLDAFGADRVMFGSNFPVDRRSISFTDLISRHARAVAHLADAARDRYFFANARDAYRLGDA